MLMLIVSLGFFIFLLYGKIYLPSHHSTASAKLNCLNNIHLPRQNSPASTSLICLSRTHLQFSIRGRRRRRRKRKRKRKRRRRRRRKRVIFYSQLGHLSVITCISSYKEGFQPLLLLMLPISRHDSIRERKYPEYCRWISLRQVKNAEVAEC